VLFDRGHRRPVGGQREQHPHARILGQVGRRRPGVDLTGLLQTAQLDRRDPAAGRLRDEHGGLFGAADLEVAPGAQRRGQPGGDRIGVSGMNDGRHPPVVGERDERPGAIRPHRIAQRRLHLHRNGFRRTEQGLSRR
jgi:hypothetical protein